MAFWNMATFEPKRNFRYKVSLSKQPEIAFLAQKVKKPSFKVDHKDYQYLNHTFMYPGRVKWDESSIEFVDVVSLTTGTGSNAGLPETKLDVISTLVGIIVKGGYSVPGVASSTLYNPSATSPAASADLKSLSKSLLNSATGDIVITQFDAEGKLLEEWTLYNTMFTSLELPELSYSSDEFSTVKVTVVYDWAQLQNVLSFVIPTEYVDLPSKGKLYPVGHPLRDKTSIEIKQMTAKEEDILTSESYIKKGIALEKLLESIIIDRNIRPESIVTVDRAAIFLATRIYAYGPQYKAQFSCPACRKQKNISYDLSTQPVIDGFDESRGFTENGTIVFELPSTKWKAECRSLFGNDEVKELSEKNKVENSLISDQLHKIIVSINGVNDKELLRRAIDVMPAKDSKYLREKYKECMPNLRFMLSMDCECDYSGEVEVPITLEFFWPK